jgi:hypothetical protein
MRGVWAGGDLTSMARFVTEAVGMGARAARAIDRGCAQRAGWAVAGEHGANRSAEPVVPLSAISLHYHPARARAASPRRPAAERVADQAEVQLGLDGRAGVGRGRSAASPAAAASTATSASPTAPTWRCSAWAGATA